MRDYQKQKSNPYLLPDYLYKTVKYTIKDYDRLRQEYNETLYQSPAPPDGMPRSNSTSDPVARRAMKREVLFDRIECIDQALVRVPPEYRRGVFDEARYGGGFPLDAGRTTYTRWKQRFVYWTAENMNLI